MKHIHHITGSLPVLLVLVLLGSMVGYVNTGLSLFQWAGVSVSYIGLLLVILEAVFDIRRKR